MIKRVRINNYKCFKEVDVTLAPLTVLIGRNDSGKSTFLSALIQLLGQHHLATQENFWRFETHNKLLLSMQTDVGYIENSAGPQARSFQGLEYLAGVTPFQVFRLPVSGIEFVCNGISDGEETPRLDTTGNTTAAFLDYLLRKDRARFDQIEVALRELIPGFQSLRITTPNPETRRVDLMVDGIQFYPNMISVGVRLIVFFVCLVYHPTPPKVIMIEEPETGVHPKRLSEIIALFRKITHGEFGAHSAQVILTTHSPYLLDMIKLEEDQVLVFRRQDDGNRTIEQVDRDRIKAFIPEFFLGEIWYNEGEDILVSRNPS